MESPQPTKDWVNRIKARRSSIDSRWTRRFAWFWLGSTAFLALTFIVLAVLLNNASFHRYLIRTGEQQCSQALGTQLHLQNFAFHLSDLSVDLYGVTVDGAAPHVAPPILQVDQVHASVRIVSILRKAWYFDDLRIDHLVAQILIDDQGVSNIPIFKKDKSSSNTSIFDLGIRHAQLDRGQVFYNNQPEALNGDLRDVEFHSSFDASQKKYAGNIVYKDGKLEFGTFRPLTHSLTAGFEATPEALTLNECKLGVGASQLLLNATVRDYSSPQVEGHYDMAIDGGQLATVLNNPSLPAGIIQTSGSIGYHETADSSLLRALQVNGDLVSSKLTIHQPSVRTEITNLRGHYSLAQGDLTLSKVYADLLGGSVSASGTMKNIGGDSHSMIEATLDKISLGLLTRATGAESNGLHANLSGRLDATAKATWGKNLDDLIAHTDATIQGQAAAKPMPGAARKSTPATEPGSAAILNADAETIPMDGVISATYTAKDGELKFDKSYVRTSQINITMNGTVGKKSSLKVGVQVGDLSELQAISNVFGPASTRPPTGSLAIAGAASFQGLVTGSTASPHLSGHLTGSNLQYNGTSWKSLKTDVDLSPEQASLRHAEIIPASRGKITLDASAKLARWSFSKDSQIQVALDASQLDLTEWARLSGQSVPVTGTLNAKFQLHGTQIEPLGNGNVALTDVTAYGEHAQAIKITVSGNGHEVLGDFSVELPEGSLHGKASVRPAERTYVAELNSTGLQLSQVEALKSRGIDLTGLLALNAHGQGSFDNPQMDATAQIPTLVVQSQTIGNVNLKVNLADHTANAVMTSSAFNTSIAAKAKISLTGDYLADASADTKGIHLQPILALYAPDAADKVSGQTEVHATLHGPLKRKELLQAQVTIPILQVNYGNSIQLAATAPIRARYENGMINVERSSIHGTDTDLQFEGSIPTAGKGPMSVLVQGSVNLQLAQLFDPDVRSSGQVKFNIDSHGDVQSNDLGGQIEIVDAGFASADLPIAVQHGNGILKVTKDRINIASFQASAGGGTLTAQGGVAYRPGIQFDMGLFAKGLRLLYPQGMREGVDANLRLAGSPDHAVLGGSVNLSEVSFTPGFDLGAFTSQFSNGVAAPPSRGLAQNLQLNIAVHSSSNVILVSRALSIGGSANLQVRGTAAEPVILGRVNLSSGDIILNGNRYVLNGGTIQFINPSQTEPVVNLALNTSIQQYSINLRFQGPVNQLRTEYSSDPALPSADIINLLAFGQTTEASAAAATPANQAAESLVASQVSSEVTSRVSKIAGISQLSISPVLAGSSSQGPPGAVITIQQRVTGNLFVNFSTNVASTQSQTVQGQYKISPRVSVSATRDPNGGFGFDALIKKSW